jgi:mannose-6-phosphate isomerase-like protein (cupin superfamily)
VAKVNGRQYRLGQGVVMLIEHGDEHEIRNNGRTPLRTLNFYSPPAYTRSGDPLPRAKP